MCVCVVCVRARTLHLHFASSLRSQYRREHQICFLTSHSYPNNGAVEIQAQRVQMDHMAEVGEELRRAVAAKEADAAVKVEQSQRIQADYFKRMIAGQIAKNEELSSSPSMRSVQKSLLEEIAARAKE